MSEADIDLKCKIVETLVRKRKTGSNKISLDTLVNYSVRDSNAGRAKSLVKDEMVPRREASVVQVGGGARENIQVADIDEAVEFLKENGGDVPFGFD